LASTPGDPQADAQLFDRWREYVNSEIELNAATAGSRPDRLECPASLSAQADCIGQRPGVDAPELDSKHRIMGCYNGHEIQQQPAAEHTDGLEIWVQKCNEINVRFGVPELEGRVQNRLGQTMGRLRTFCCNASHDVSRTCP
jgi:hypothetical protein